jgi:hypothetical protein
MVWVGEIDDDSAVVGVLVKQEPAMRTPFFYDQILTE